MGFSLVDDPTGRHSKDSDSVSEHVQSVVVWDRKDMYTNSFVSLGPGAVVQFQGWSQDSRHGSRTKRMKQHLRVVVPVSGSTNWCQFRQFLGVSCLALAVDMMSPTKRRRRWGKPSLNSRSGWKLPDSVHLMKKKSISQGPALN